MTNLTPKHRPVRSFVKRSGRISNAQRHALITLGSRFILPFTSSLLDWRAAFGRTSARVLEIGFGMGTATAEIARQQPERDFLGIEVHEAGIGALLKLIEMHGLNNIRVIQHDAVEVIDHMIENNSLDGVHIFFPDPWHKARHHKRRLIQLPFVSRLALKLKLGGYLHCATDWKNYAQNMLEAFHAEPLLRNLSAIGAYVPRPAHRPVTKFERRGQQLGHGTWDLIFERHA
jgi:tRNA (guanine-N7-)-methyltransferase